MALQAPSRASFPEAGALGFAGRWAPGSDKRLLHALILVAFQVVLNGVGFGVITPALLGGAEFEFRGAPTEFVAVAVMAALGIGLDVGIAFSRVSATTTATGWSWYRIFAS